MSNEKHMAELERRVKRLERIVGSPSVHEDFYSYELVSPLELDKARR